jgi:hypothetical protein
MDMILVSQPPPRGCVRSLRLGACGVNKLIRFSLSFIFSPLFYYTISTNLYRLPDIPIFT